MMLDRDGIIKGLECCSYLDKPNCAECPEDGPGFGFACRDDLMKQACFMLKMLDVTPEELKRLKLCRYECKVDCLLESFNRVVEERDALRKTREPRLMTLEDFKNNPDIDDQGRLPCWVEYKDDEYNEWSFVTDWELADAKNHRYWTSRPTDKQMEEAAWDE